MISTLLLTISLQALVEFGLISTVYTFDLLPLDKVYLSNNSVLCPSSKLFESRRQPVSTIMIGVGMESK